MEELIFLVVWPLVFLGLLLAVIMVRERRYSFSLRVMLVVMTLFAVWLGIIMALYHIRE
jgi:hypothetical protein